jgi:hypothetical protein
VLKRVLVLSISSLIACADQVDSLDSGTPDSGRMDSGAADTGVTDTGADSGTGDTGADTGVIDTGAMDSGVDEDAGAEDAMPVCPIGIDDTAPAVLRVTADDDRQVYLNELLVDDLNPSRTWGTISVLSVDLYRHPARENVIAVRAENYYRIDGLDRGLLLDLTDSVWVAPVQEIQHSGGVYGAIFGTSSAWWIWLYDANIAASMKPITETMLARRRFYILMDGSFSDTAGTCP